MASERVNRRKYPRIRAPKGTWVGWRSASQTSTSRAENMGLGGLFLRTENPPNAGSMLELIFDLPTGEVRARAIVRRSTPGKGMGVQFIQMRPEDRAKLNQFLSRQEDRPGITASDTGARHGTAYLTLVPQTEETVRRTFEKEAQNLAELTGKATYYQLLGVTPTSTRSEIKRAYYQLARKFHPDRNVGSGEFMERLKELMTVTTEAYRTLESAPRRADYDKSLATSGAFSLHRGKTEAGESLEESHRRANECLRAGNFVGSIVSLRKCVEAAPDNASYRASLARSLGTLPQYHNEAVEHYEKAIELDPWQESVYLQFAELLERMRLASRASAVYSRLLEINPVHVRARERLGALTGKQRDESSSGFVSQLFGKKR